MIGTFICDGHLTLFGERSPIFDTVKSKKFFGWVHLYDAHTPYEPPEPFASQFPGQPYLGEIAYADTFGAPVAI